MLPVTIMYRSYIIYCMLLCDVQLINSYICKPLDLLVAETALEKKNSMGREAVARGSSFRRPGALRALLRSTGD